MNPFPPHAIPTTPFHRHAGIAYWFFLLLLCSAYLQGGLEKALDFAMAVEEMRRFKLEPAGPLALLTILVELGASLLVLSGVRRWIGAACLALFTLAANFVANRFWEIDGPARTMLENGFFEHLGLVGAFMIVAWVDLRARSFG